MKGRNSLQKALAVLLILALAVMPVSMGTAAAAGDFEGATVFTFSDSAISVEEETYTGYQIEGTDLTVNGSGTYVLSGSCSDGSVTVKKGTTGVTLVLSGLALTSSDTAPITCSKSTSVTIMAADGTVNTLADSALNNDEKYPDNKNAENAVIKCKDGSRVRICGAGTINITAKGKNGIKGGASTEGEGAAGLTVEDVTLNITAAVNDGIKSDQELNIRSGRLSVSAADDAIKSDYVLNIGETGSDGPTICITGSKEGIEAATVNIYSGNISVSAANDGINAANSDLTGYRFACNIYGGTVNLNVSAGDGIDSNGAINISGGVLTVCSSQPGRDGCPIDSDGAFTLTGGTVLAIGSSSLAQVPDSASQCYVAYGYTGSGGRPGARPGGGGGSFVSAGAKVEILDESGRAVGSGSSARAANYVFFTSSDLAEGEIYTLSVNGAPVATAAAGFRGGGSQQTGPGPVDPGPQPIEPGPEPVDPVPPPIEPGPEPVDPGPPPDGPGPEPVDPGPPPDGPSVFYKDVAPSDWFADAVRFVSEHALMNGTGPETFSPDTVTTRAMVATILYRLVGSPQTAYTEAFIDVSGGEWYSEAVSWAADNGVYLGYPDGTFRPDEPITRQQLAAVLYRYAELTEQDVSAEDDLCSFIDGESVAEWALAAVRWAVGSGVINGYDDATLRPRGGATRAQLAQMLMNWLA